MSENKIPILAEVVTTYRPSVSPSQMPVILNSRDVPPLVLEQWEGIWNYESIYVLLMSQSNRVLGIAKVSQGGVSQCIIDIKVVLQKALTGNASNVILIHNHPSGNMHASKDDDNITNRLKLACDAIGVQLLDHVIIDGDGRFYSYADEGRM